MSIIISSRDRQKRIAYFGEDEWLLVELIPALEAWLEKNKGKIPAGDYIADVGYYPREGATGGGPVLSPGMLRTMADLGMWLYLSEYNSFEESGPNQSPQRNAGIGPATLDSASPPRPAMSSEKTARPQSPRG